MATAAAGTTTIVAANNPPPQALLHQSPSLSFLFDVFHGLAKAFIVFDVTAAMWVSVHLPPILLANTLILLASSFTLKQRAAARTCGLFGIQKVLVAHHGFGVLFVADSWLRGGNWSHKASTSQATRAAALYFHRRPRHPLAGGSARFFFTFPSANPIRKEFRSARPRKSLRTTGISWMDFGFFCSLCFTLGK